MGILIFNTAGLVATLVVMVPLLLVIMRLEEAGWSRPQAMALFFIGGSTVLAVSGLIWDRRERGDFFRTYWANYRQVIYHSFGTHAPAFAFKEGRRTAMFLVPLAVIPLCVFAGYSLFLAKASWQCVDTS